ncbi:MAG: SMP-30/gluconolactonase/LRE family protein [Planctomycetaceae bacterium]|jgi:DNA-binding beta-propeller fold protein YncE|nr:SMP-30/gluconolactonase/LRE family protein [Planctomycetaceae bacterium]
MKRFSLIAFIAVCVFVSQTLFTQADETANKAAEKTLAKAKLFAKLPAEMNGPDGLTVSPKTGTIFLTVPNFNSGGRANDSKVPKKYPGVLAKVGIDGTVEKILEFPVLAETGQTGCMGLVFGPDGHLYVCDNQYFFNTDHKSRVLRVLMDGDKPTGEVEVAVEGLNLANAAAWYNNKLYVSDTFLDIPGKTGAGGIWAFSSAEILKAGKGKNPPIKVRPATATSKDRHLIVIKEAKKSERGDNAGFDGITFSADGTLYTGNFGDGTLYAIKLNRNGAVRQIYEIHKGESKIKCCDGIYYDKRTKKIYINDSQRNAIWAFRPLSRRELITGAQAKLELIAENGDTTGEDGSLDQPCECVAVGNKLIIVNFDWPFPGLVNTKYDEPSTLSVIELP